MTRKEAAETYHTPVETLDETLQAMGLMYESKIEEVVATPSKTNRKEALCVICGGLVNLENLHPDSLEIPDEDCHETGERT